MGEPLRQRWRDEEQHGDHSDVGDRHLHEQTRPSGRGPVHAFALQPAPQQRAVHRCGDAGGGGEQHEWRRKARVMRGQNDEQVERHVHSECDQTDPHRSPRVLPREIAGGEHFDEAEPNQTPGVGHQTVLGHLHVAITELSVAEDGGRDGPGKHEESNRRRDDDEHHEAQCPIERRGETHGIPSRMLRRQPRQDHGGERDGKHPQCELHESISVVQPGDAAGHQERGDHGIEQQTDLRHRGAQNPGKHELADPLHTLRSGPPARPTE